MRILTIVIILVTYSVFQAAYFAESQGSTSFEFPTFTLLVQPPDPGNVTAGCSGFTDCIGYVGTVIRFGFVALVSFLLIPISLAIYVVELFIFFFSLTFQGIDGAPWYVNVLIILPFVGGIVIIVVRIIRSGDDDA